MKNNDWAWLVSVIMNEIITFSFAEFYCVRNLDVLGCRNSNKNQLSKMINVLVPQSTDMHND